MSIKLIDGCNIVWRNASFTSEGSVKLARGIISEVCTIANLCSPYCGAIGVLIIVTFTLLSTNQVGNYVDVVLAALKA